MGLRESLKRLQESERLSVKREVKKELTKIKKTLKKTSIRCVVCGSSASHQLKDSNDYYCRDCALEYFGKLGYLKKI